MSTSIGVNEGGEYKMHGTSLVQLAEKGDFVGSLWFAWTGSVPEENIHKLLSMSLVACIDHGENPPSAQVSRITASCGKPLADCVSAGLLTFGSRHGNAGSSASLVLRDLLVMPGELSTKVEQTVKKLGRLPGFGHPEYEVDPRAQLLLDQAQILLGEAPHCALARKVSVELTRIKQKPIPVNIDGALGALIADIAAPAELADALFIIARSVGLIAHAREEAEQSKSYKRGK